MYDGPGFAMSRGAIAALAELAYRYSATLLANNLVVFYEHAGQWTVKTDDVLLMAWKDGRGMLAELRRAMAEDLDRFGEGTKRRRRPSARPKSGAATTTTASKRASAGGDNGHGRKRTGSKSRATT